MKDDNWDKIRIEAVFKISVGIPRSPLGKRQNLNPASSKAKILHERLVNLSLK
jgi:hypothetical protein